MKQAKSSKLIFWTGIVILVFVLLAFGIAAVVQPFRLDRYVKPLVIIHIALTMGWLVLFICQSRLALTGNMERHRRNAAPGILLVILIAIEAIYITYDWGDPVRFVGESRDVLAFAALFFASIWAAGKGKPETHKRLMQIACLNLINPAITRVGFIFGWSNGTLIAVMLLLWILVPVIHDLVTIRSIHKATIGGIIFSIVSFGLMIAVVISPLMGYIESLLFSG